MAKGDVSTGQQAMQQPPKIDQYSVMHKLMDALGGNQPAQNMAPSPDMTMPNPNINMTQAPAGAMGGRMGFGQGMPRSGDIGMGVPQVPTLGPSDPQTALRRNMNGTRTFGG